MPKKYRVEITAAAERDLREIRDYIACDKPVAAVLSPKPAIHDRSKIWYNAAEFGVWTGKWVVRQFGPSIGWLRQLGFCTNCPVKRLRPVTKYIFTLKTRRRECLCSGTRPAFFLQDSPSGGEIGVAERRGFNLARAVTVMLAKGTVHKSRGGNP